MQLLLFSNLTEAEKSQAVEDLIEQSSPRQDFFFMIVLAVVMAIFGLFMNNDEVVIGSMLIAPLLYPILSLGLGIVIADWALIGRSIKTIFVAMVLSLTAALVVGLVFAAKGYQLTGEWLVRFEPSLSYAGVAFIAGLAASFATTKPVLKRYGALPGIAISVALIPPLAAVGAGLASFDMVLASGALIMFGSNVLGIVFASVIVFSLMRLAVEQQVAQEALEEDEREIEMEERIAEENQEKNDGPF